jgi:hypothetical protein
MKAYALEPELLPKSGPRLAEVIRMARTRTVDVSRKEISILALA